MSTYEFYVFNDGAYPRVPSTEGRKSHFVDLPSDTYDDAIGQRVFEDHLDTAVLVEKLGLDGVIISEQHNGPIGLYGNPMMAGAWIAARTERIRVVVNGSLLNSYRTPVRMAEEIVALDIMSRGRAAFGLPLGHGMQHHSTGVMNPAEARERFREAHDLLFRALTDPGPFEWNGKFFHIPYVNLWPRPLQKPDPEVWVPGGGSTETLELVAEHRYTYQAVLSPPDAMRKNLDRLRGFAQGHGYELDPRQIAVVINVHVAETDVQARQEFEAHALWMYQNFFRSPAHDNFPPGYVSPASLRGMLSGGYRSTPLEKMTFDELMANRWVVAGSPDTVAEEIAAIAELFGAGRIVLDFNAGTKHRWLMHKSMWLFAEEVLPKLRPGGASPVQDAAAPGYRTVAEYGARIADAGDAIPKPAARVDGRLRDVTMAHLDPGEPGGTNGA